MEISVRVKLREYVICTLGQLSDFRRTMEGVRDEKASKIVTDPGCIPDRDDGVATHPERSFSEPGDKRG